MTAVLEDARPPASPPALSALETAAVQTVAYSDVFDYAPTTDQIWCFLPLAASHEEVSLAVSAAGPLAELVSTLQPFHVLRGREALVHRRSDTLLASQHLWRSARSFGSVIARMPFVRMVAVTGALAVDNAVEGDDIDFMVVTTKGRVWFARALVIALVRLARLRGVNLCPNYFLAEDALELPDRDLYTARELLQMAPLSGYAVYRELLEANAWWSDLLPNAAPAPAPSGREAKPIGLLERMFGGRAGDGLERIIMRRKAGQLARHAAGNPECVFSESTCKGHAGGYRSRTREALAARLRPLGVEAP